MRIGVSLSEFVNVRLTPEMLAELDAYVTEERARAPGRRFGRSDAIRSIVFSVLDARKKAREEASKGEEK